MTKTTERRIESAIEITIGAAMLITYLVILSATIDSLYHFQQWSMF